MSEEKMRKLWGISMIMIGITSLALLIISIADISISEGIKKSIGLIDVIMLPILSYTTVKLYWRK